MDEIQSAYLQSSPLDPAAHGVVFGLEECAEGEDREGPQASLCWNASRTSVRSDTKHPAMVRLWARAWAECVPFLQFDVEIRKIVCTTTTGASTPLSAGPSHPRALPDGQAALRCAR